MSRPFTEAEIRDLVRDSETSCRCDGGNTMGCRSCVADRKISLFDEAQKAVARRYTNFPDVIPREPKGKNPWRDAIEEACVCCFIDFHPLEPKRTLANLIQWNVQTALDPAVSEAAAKLLATPPPDAVSQADGHAGEVLVSREILQDMGAVGGTLVNEILAAGLTTGLPRTVPRRKKIECEQCGDCDGTGIVEGSAKYLLSTCKTCRGQGKVPKQ